MIISVNWKLIKSKCFKVDWLAKLADNQMCHYCASEFTAGHCDIELLTKMAGT